jgi:hypothetical protein
VKVILVSVVLGFFMCGAAHSQATKAGDTVTVVIHHVLPAKRAEYDSLLQKVWAPAARRAGKKYPAFGKAFETRRRYVPTKMGADSTYTYVYLYTDHVSVPESPLGNDVLAAANFTKPQLDAYRDALRACLAPSSGGSTLVDEPYR